MLARPAAVACAAFAVDAAAAPVPFDCAFHQLDWYDDTGALVEADSLWARFDWSYIPGGVPCYLNVRVQDMGTGQDAWVVRNLPLFPTGAPQRDESVHFDLSRIGLSSGDDWGGLLYTAVADPLPRELADPPPAPATPAVAQTLARQATHPNEENPQPGPFATGGGPEGVEVDGAAGKINADRDVRGVQEADKHCMAGAFARSLDWLNRRYELGLNKTPQDFYDDLVDAGVSDTSDGDGDEAWIGIKNDVAKTLTGNRIVTKVWDADAFLDPIPGITEDSGNIVSWLLNELVRGHDVELAWTRPGLAHIVTVLQVYNKDGETWVMYRDDENQGLDAESAAGASKGDSRIKHAKLYFDGDAYRLSADTNRVHFAVSEAPDCNANGVADSTDLEMGTAQDLNLNGILDACEEDAALDPSAGVQRVIAIIDDAVGQIEEAQGFAIDAAKLIDGAVFLARSCRPCATEALDSMQAAQQHVSDALLEQGGSRSALLTARIALVNAADQLSAGAAPRIVMPMIEQAATSLDTAVARGQTAVTELEDAALDAVTAQILLADCHPCAAIPDSLLAEAGQRLVQAAGLVQRAVAKTQRARAQVGGIADALMCPGDANNDGDMNVDDLIAIILCWDTSGVDCPENGDNGDVNFDGIVDVDDLVLLIVNWGRCPVDVSPPVITCPPSVRIECTDPIDPGALGFATATDNADPAPIINVIDNFIPGPCMGSGTIVRTWIATDASGNVAECEQIITLVDTTPPELTVPARVTIACGDPLNIKATAFDACGQPEITVTDNSDGTCDQVFTVFWTATDPCGNQSKGQTVVTVLPG